MTLNRHAISCVGASIAISLALASPGRSQIVPDSTLPTDSMVVPNGNTLTIEGGTVAGDNLFHSFSDFSVLTGTEAFFNNGANIDNIISRVTGRSISDIDGLIRANNSASLFLLNPNGVVFGPNASLDIGGSLVVSTADALEFADGSTFSAANPQTPPILTVSAPVGLQFRPPSRAIVVRNTGHDIASASFDPLPPNTQPGLDLAPNQTLALVGGSVSLEGGIVSAESGRIELGGVERGRVALQAVSQGWNLDYSDVTRFGSVSLLQLALADASGTGGSSIQVRGDRLSVTDGSLLLILQDGTQTGGGITLNTTQSIDLIGFPPDMSVASGVVSNVVGDGRGGDIVVSTSRLRLQDGGRIHSYTFAAGSAGDIIINAFESINQIGSFGSIDQSSIASQTLSSGNTGSITVSTQRIRGIDGGALFTQTGGTGSAGDILINASELVEFAGLIPGVGGGGSSLLAGTIGPGNAGSIVVNTGRLVLRDGGNFFVSTGAEGMAGSIVVNASESVTVRGAGVDNGSEFPSFINASGLLVDEVLRDILGLPPFPTGATGGITINTPRLTVADGASISVGHQGVGDAGALQINADRIVVNREGSITASTADGSGGNIAITSEDVRLRDESAITAAAGGAGVGGNITINSDRLNLLESHIEASTASGNGGAISLNGENILMRRNSLISTEAGGTGNGGDIFIDTETLVGLNNSDIVANAFEGNGGNIQIIAEGVIGLQVRDQLTPFSDITASSEFGIDGNIEIITPDVNSDDVFESLRTDTIDAGDTVAYCAGLTAADVTFTGRGGIPENPRLLLEHPIALEDLGSDEPLPEEKTSNSRTEEISTPLVEAGGWIEGRNGVELVTMPRIANTDAWMRRATCEDASAVSQH